MLSRDRDLPECREIARGCYVHALEAGAQLREVADRYGLATRARPFTRCLRCNLELRPVDKAEIGDALPPKVRESQARFVGCDGCGRIYWPGSHYACMRAALGDLLGTRTVGTRRQFAASPARDSLRQAPEPSRGFPAGTNLAWQSAPGALPPTGERRPQ